jgi:hypothetical protein
MVHWRNGWHEPGRFGRVEKPSLSLYAAVSSNRRTGDDSAIPLRTIRWPVLAERCLDRAT